jgi:hypothetical protein
VRRIRTRQQRVCHVDKPRSHSASRALARLSPPQFYYATGASQQPPTPRMLCSGSRGSVGLNLRAPPPHDYSAPSRGIASSLRADMIFGRDKREVACLPR